MSPNDLKRKFYFQKLCAFSASSQLTVGQADKFLCPLCWTPIRHADSSIEHVLPRSVGGRHETLTCRFCNSRDGSDLDSQLYLYQRAQDGAHGQDVFDARLFIDDFNVGAELKFPPRNVYLKVIEKKSDPRHVEELVRMRHFEKIKFEYSQRYVPRLLKIGLLRCAYLTGFATLGYHWADQTSVASIRTRIRERSFDDFELNSTVGHDPKTLLRLTERVACGLHRIDGTMVLVVVLQLLTNSHSSHVVILPGIDCTSDAYERATAGYFLDKKKLNLNQLLKCELPIPLSPLSFYSVAA